MLDISCNRHEELVTFVDHAKIAETAHRRRMVLIIVKKDSHWAMVNYCLCDQFFIEKKQTNRC